MVLIKNFIEKKKLKRRKKLFDTSKDLNKHLFHCPECFSYNDNAGVSGACKNCKSWLNFNCANELHIDEGWTYSRFRGSFIRSREYFKQLRWDTEKYDK